MTFLLPVTINGVEYQAHAEYTSSAVGAFYKEKLRPFTEVFNLGLGATSPDTDPIKTQILKGCYASKMKKSIEALMDVAANGMVDPNDPVNPNRRHYLSIEMSSSFNQLINSLKAAGATINGTSVTISDANIVEWKSLSVNSDAVRQIIDFTLATAEDQNRTLQALVELIYVKTGNEILTQNLNSLEEALSTTKDSLKTLTSLQDLHNKIEVTKKSQSFSVYASTFIGININGINQDASEYFTELQPTVNTENISNSDTALFLELRNDLNQQISILKRTTPGAGTDEDAGTLLDKLRTVKDHIDKAINKANSDGSTEKIKSALRYWILDNETTGAEIADLEPGEIQREITAALSAGQSLNDSQKEEVRRYLFVFEEYYKSAAAILNKVTQILERMAQGIAR